MKATHTFQAEQTISGYENKTIVQGISLSIPSNKISVIIGANACGKSTLLKTLARLIKPTSGSITLDGKQIDKIPPKQLARVLGLLPQSPIVPEGISVADLVGRGRFPHQTLFSGWSKKDYEAVAEAMEIMKITELANQNIDELSGGQRQRVWIAMALAQQTDILFLDEPTTFLDITYQVEILDLLTDLNRKHGTTIVMVLHDINLSSRYADHIFALRQGKLVAEGAPSEVITSELVKDIFGMDSAVIQDPVSGTPLIVPIGRHHVKPVTPANPAAPATPTAPVDSTVPAKPADPVLTF
ncbi:iron complex transport system ATP-binding protein [Paenibacillus cellulosilyticus]|uniref:Iron complex transport system ATP-binding protein n=1 Tax=Paenibacillus cellulosilyticus TaxID=375489 RepID=A0A2V2YND2_9BACL|nr:ABC transporter ATP-binding protein [Paenibacillus cellulosilyticus]PWV97276.1 iron complex transport system ATP-binding protein [Paenibacillus cellulosilyticus]QKS47517.1 ABC transporter ATP-binding protein [Paenibacillus cellulosilyticus]